MVLGRRLVEELPGWFENHATGMDAALAYYLRRDQVRHLSPARLQSRPRPTPVGAAEAAARRDGGRLATLPPAMAGPASHEVEQANA